MGRKKKEMEEVKIEESEKELETTPKQDSIKYKGIIGLSIVKNGKIVKTTKLHNNGRYPLFQFLCECLRGNYKNAEAFRPKYISLFEVSEDQYRNIAKGTASIANLFNSSNRTTIGAITFKGTPHLEITSASKTDMNGSAKLTYTFSIPFMKLINNNANALALFGSENWDGEYSNPSAYYLNIVNGKLTKLIENESLDANYSIIIDWTMTFEN